MSKVSRVRSVFASAIGGALFAAGLFFVPQVAHAQPASVDYSGVDAAPAIWRITDEDSEIYLFGTFHILPPSLKWETDELNLIIDRIDALYLEADVHTPEAQARVQAMVPALAFNPPGVTLSGLLDDDANTVLARVAPTVGASPAMMEPMRPWFAQLFLGVSQMQMLGFDPSAGVEMALLAQVDSQPVEMGFFETAEEQLGFLADIPDEVHARGFADSLRELEQMPEILEEMVRSWAAGDMAAIDQLINESMRDDSPEVYDALIVQRNHNWVPQIREILDGEGVVLIAVGAGHMPGENGLIALLAEAGIEAERE
jgi:uncharacterized protein YbaP (TraB family)